NRACDRQSKTQASACRHGLTICLFEWLKDFRQALSVDPAAAVLDGKSKPVDVRFEFDVDPAAWRCEFDGIAQEIVNHLMQANSGANDESFVGAHVDIEI